MKNVSHLAEIKYPTLGFSLYGVVQQMGPQQMSLLLQTTPVNPEAFSPAMPVDVMIVVKGTVHAARMQVMSSQENRLSLAFVSSLQEVQRRAEARYECSLPASFRPIHSSGCFGIWNEARVYDISLGGMRLEFDPTLEIPRRIEILFKLSDPSHQGRSSARVYGDEGLELVSAAEENYLIRCTGRVCHSRVTPYGRVSVGVAFTKMGAMDKLKLARFLSEASTQV